MFALKLPGGTSCFEVSLRKGWLSFEHGQSRLSAFDLRKRTEKCCFEVWKNEGTTNPTPGIASTWDVWRFHFLPLLWLNAFHPIFWTTSQHPRVRSSDARTELLQCLRNRRREFDSSRIHDEIQGVFLLRFRSYIPPPPRAPAGSGNSTFHFFNSHDCWKSQSHHPQVFQ